MSTCRFPAVVLAISLVPLTLSAETYVQWGESPSGAGTPGTNIVGANQSLIGAGTTYNGNATNSPIVGANYYPDATGRSPRFAAGVSSISVGGGRLVENAVSGDRFAIYGQTLPPGGTFRGMVMWASNFCLITDRPITLTNATAVTIQRAATGTITNQGMRIVVKQGDSYFISESAGFGSVISTQSFPLASLSWYAFTPFTSGTETIGSSVPAPSLVNVQAVGFYFTSQNAGASPDACGINTTYFSVEGFEDNGGGSFTLSALPDDPSHGSVSPTGGTYSAGSTVELAATASNYYQFAGWTGDLGGTTNPVTITMNGNKAVLATFSPVLATNGTPHWWLAAYGLPTNDVGALSDNDVDGHQAWQEYIAGTLPNNPTSVLRLTSLSLAAGHPALAWTSASGRVYQVSWSTNVQGGYTPFADATNLPWTSSTYTDLLHSAEQRLNFRVDVRRE